MAIRMRRGNEADFDPSKMLPGEWAVSTDTKYVRMCFSPGIVLRMATYEAFESDMAEIRKILSECQSIQTAVELIQQNVTNSELVIENYVKEAKQYRDEAEQFRNEASMFAPEGYEDLVKNVSDNTVKIDTIIEKAELNIKNNSRGSNIHLTDSADSNVVALELYGKTEQNAYTGKNLLDCSKLVETTKNNVTFTPVYENGMLQYINVNGTASADTTYSLQTVETEIGESYTISGCPSDGSNTSYRLRAQGYANDIGNGATWTTISTITNVGIIIEVFSGTVCNNLKFYPMISLEGGEYEPYVGGKPSPSPSYPQEIKSVVLNTIKTHGKNMANPKEFIGGVLPYNPNLNFTESKSWYSSDFIDVSNINRLSISANMQVVRFNCYDANKNCILYRANIINTIPFTPYVTELPENTKYIRITVGLDNGSWNNADALFAEYWVQVEKGEATEYQQYQSTEITLSEPIELNGFNGVYDVVTSDGATRRFAKKRILSSDIADIRITSNGNYVYTHELSDVKIYGSCLCTHFVGIGYDDRVLNPNSQRCYIDSETKIIYFRDNLENLVFTDLENAKTLFDENEVYLLYELATPTTEALQSDFTALKTFYPETYVSNDADCDMSITYTADAKNYIDNKIALLTTAIYNNI